MELKVNGIQGRNCLWGLSKMADILQKTFSDKMFRKKIRLFLL